MKEHYEKTMCIAICLFNYNLVLCDIFKLHWMSCNGHGFLVVESYSLKYNKTKESEFFGDDLKFGSFFKMKHWIYKESAHF